MDFLQDPLAAYEQNDTLIDDLIQNAYQQAYDTVLQDALTPPKIYKPSTRSTKNSKKQNTLLSATPVVDATGGGKGGSAAPVLRDANGRRLSKAERIALETELYHNEKNAANQDLLSKALVGAGALGVGALLGRKALRRGYDLAKDYHLENEVSMGASKESERINRRPSFLDPRFWAASMDDASSKAAQQTRLKEIYTNPLKAAGAAAYRLGMDVVNDGTRSYYWRYNHPLAILTDTIDKTVDPAGALRAADKRAIAFAVSVPAIAAAGAYDPTNPSELFRPAGMKQNNPDPDNPRQSTEPATELLQRFFMGRTGRPLAYAEAKKDLPDLTPERYKNYLRFSYQDKGPLGLGMVKVTGENLEGVPEARVFGYPVTIPMVTIAGLGAAGAGLATTLSENAYRDQAAAEVEKRMRVQQTPEGSYTYERYRPETMTDPVSGTTVETGKRVPADTWASAATKEDLPNPRARTTIDEYVGPKGKGLLRQQRLLALAGVGAGTVAGHFLGNYLNNLVASNRNSPEQIPSTQEYGVS